MNVMFMTKERGRAARLVARVAEPGGEHAEGTRCRAVQPGREWMFTVDGAQPPDAVHEEIVARLQKLAPFAARSRPDTRPGRGPEHA